MPIRPLVAAVVGAALLAGAAPAGAQSAAVRPAADAAARPLAPRVRLETDSGTIVVELYPTRAPATVGNFLTYVVGGLYDGGAFYRAVTMQNQPANPIRIEVIQGGVDADSARRLPPIPHETTERSGLRHRDGTLSMARSTPGSAASEFFITIGDQPELDFGGRRNPDGQGFAAFGQVVEGMEVVRRIQRMPSAGEPPQRMATTVRIRRAVAEPPAAVP